jgi:hypothetical protein
MTICCTRWQISRAWSSPQATASAITGRRQLNLGCRALAVSAGFARG